jgi:hypothetical protein
MGALRRTKMTYEILESTHEVSVYDADRLVAVFFGPNAADVARRFVIREEHLNAVADVLWGS